MEKLIIDDVAIAYHCHWEKDGVEHGHIGSHLIQMAELPLDLAIDIRKAIHEKAKSLHA